MIIAKRHLRRFSLLLPLALAVMLSACGTAPNPTGPIFNVTKSVGTSGGSIEDPNSGTSVSFARGALSAATPVTLKVVSDQFSAVLHKGYLTSDRGVTLSFDPTQVTPGGSVDITAGFKGTYDSFGTLLAVMKKDGSFLALPSEQDGTGKVEGELSEKMLEVLFPKATPGEQEDLKIFTANRNLSPEPSDFTSSVGAFENGTWDNVPPDLTGKRVALVVHGLDSSLADLKSLGQFIANFKLPGQTKPYYNVVIGYQYTSNEPIAFIGADLASFMNTTGLQNAASVDLFAHSMGNLVARYAMETTSLPNRIANVSHYVSLGGPHDGVPFGNLDYAVQTFFYLYPFEDGPCLKDLVTDGKGGKPTETDFLINLDLLDTPSAHGPNYTTTQYYTMSGGNWNDYDYPVGYTISYLYWLSVGSVYSPSNPLGYDVIEDGLVANYSAQSNVLSRQSQSWQANQPFLKLSHTGLHDSQEAFDQIGKWIEGWQ